MPAYDPMLVDTTIPSEMEVIRDRFFKGHKVVEPGGLPPFFFNEVGSVNSGVNETSRISLRRGRDF